MPRPHLILTIAWICAASLGCRGGTKPADHEIPPAATPSTVVDATDGAIVHLEEYLDDAVWPGQDAATPDMVELELYRNDFEQVGSLEGWALQEISGRLQFSRSPQIARDGSHSLAVASVGGRAQGYAYVVVPVRGEGTLHVRASLHCGSMQSYNAGFTCGLLVGEHAGEPAPGMTPLVQRPLGAPDPDMPGDWRELDALITPLPSTRFVKIDVPLAAWGQASGTVFLDELVLTHIPAAEASAPHASRTEASGETRAGIQVPGDTSITWRVRAGEATQLRLSATGSSPHSGAASVTIRDADGGEVTEPIRWELGPVGHPLLRGWMDGTVDLAPYHGHAIDITLAAEKAPVLWANPRLVTPDEGPPRGVVLISVDTLRADHLGCYGYERPTSPFIDSLADRGLLFREARSHSSWTLPSHVSMLTGRTPLDHGVDNFGESLGPEFITLPGWLRDHGVTTLASTTHVFVSPAFGIDQGFDRLAYTQDPPPEDAVAAALRMVETLDPGPFFLFVHLFTPHWDYAPPPHYKERFDPDYTGTMTGTWPEVRRFDAPGAPMPPRDLSHVIALYDAEIRYTDDAVMQLVEGLERAGLGETTTVIFTADHGEEFKDHGRMGHGMTLYEEQLRAPLIIAGPGAAPDDVDTPVQHVDLMPTICNLLGLPTPDEIPGLDLLAIARDAATSRPHLAETKFHGPWRRSLIDGDHKLVVEMSTGQEMLFDLAADPAERLDRAAQDPVTLLSMRSQLAQLVAEEEQRRKQRELEEDSGPVLTQGQEAHLRALGYIQ